MALRLIALHLKKASQMKTQLIRLGNLIHQNDLFEQNVHPTFNQRTSALKVFL